MRRTLRELASKALWALGPTRPARAGRGRLTVVTFHRVLPAGLRSAYPFPGLVVTPEELEWFLAFFRMHYAIDTLANAVARWDDADPDGAPRLAVTFDDGQVDNFEYARPILDKAGVKATFFVASAHVEQAAPLWHDRLGFAALAALERRERGLSEMLGALGIPVSGDSSQIPGLLANRLKAFPPEERDRWIARAESVAGAPVLPAWDGMMTWDQLRMLQRAGHEIGSHSETHPILPQCTDSELAREISGSKALLEERLGVEVATFCYPNGDFDARVAAAVACAGYHQAVTTRGGPNRPGASRFELGRCDIVAEHSATRDGGLSEATLAWRLSGLHPGLG